MPQLLFESVQIRQLFRKSSRYISSLNAHMQILASLDYVELDCERACFTKKTYVYRVLPTMVSSSTKNKLFLILAITDNSNQWKIQSISTVYVIRVEKRTRNWSTIHIRDHWKCTASKYTLLGKISQKMVNGRLLFQALCYKYSTECSLC